MKKSSKVYPAQKNGRSFLSRITDSKKKGDLVRKKIHRNLLTNEVSLVIELKSANSKEFHPFHGTEYYPESSAPALIKKYL